MKGLYEPDRRGGNMLHNRQPDALRSFVLICFASSSSSSSSSPNHRRPSCAESKLEASIFSVYAGEPSRIISNQTQITVAELAREEGGERRDIEVRHLRDLKRDYKLVGLAL